MLATTEEQPCGQTVQPSCDLLEPRPCLWDSLSLLLFRDCSPREAPRLEKGLSGVTGIRHAHAEDSMRRHLSVYQQPTGVPKLLSPPKISRSTHLPSDTLKWLKAETCKSQHAGIGGTTFRFYRPRIAAVAAGGTRSKKCKSAGDQDDHDSPPLDRDAAPIKNLALPVVVQVPVHNSGSLEEFESTAYVVDAPGPLAASVVVIVTPPSTHCEEPVHLP